jgi:hypothetical protein
MAHACRSAHPVHVPERKRVHMFDKLEPAMGTAGMHALHGVAPKTCCCGDPAAVTLVIDYQATFLAVSGSDAARRRLTRLRRMARRTVR